MIFLSSYLALPFDQGHGASHTKGVVCPIPGVCSPQSTEVIRAA
jgi:hypothetical protein